MSRIDRNSETWRTIRAALGEFGAEAHKELATPLAQERRSDFLRGRISLINDLERLANPEHGLEIAHSSDT